jgi:hypothetical protein
MNVRSIVMLEAAGYQCTKAGGSPGLFDVIAIGTHDVRCVQVQSGTARCRPLERGQLQRLPVPGDGVERDVAVPDRCRARLIERIERSLMNPLE